MKYLQKLLIYIVFIASDYVFTTIKPYKCQN